MLNYEFGEVVPIAIFRANNNGAGQANQNQRANVYNVNTGLEVASQLVLSASGPTGYYRNLWTSNITARSTLLVIIYNGTGASGTILNSYFIRIVDNVQQVKDTVDLSDGRAI